MSWPLARGRDQERGQAILFILIALVVGFLVGGIRFLKLGDISFTAKMGETLLWGLGSAVVALLMSGLASLVISRADHLPQPRRREGASRAVAPEELSAIESELPERERPEFGGVHGRPPEEMAEMIRKMAGGDGV